MDDLTELVMAIGQYRKDTGDPFPAVSRIFAIMTQMGWQRTQKIPYAKAEAAAADSCRCGQPAIPRLTICRACLEAKCVA